MKIGFKPKKNVSGHNILHLDFLFEDDEATTSTRKNNVWIYWVDFEQVNKNDII